MTQKTDMMKNISFLVLISVLLTFGLVQQAQAQRFKAGLIGGVNLAQLDGDKLTGFNKIGFNAGARVSAVLHERWQLSIEMLYAQQGSSRTKDDDLSSIYDKIRLNFVEVPVMINFLEWKFHVSAGFSYARLINFEVIDYTGTDTSDLQNFNSNIFSGILGATYYFNEHIGLNVRWSKYFNDLSGEGDNQLIGRIIGIRGIYMF